MSCASSPSVLARRRVAEGLDAARIDDAHGKAGLDKRADQRGRIGADRLQNDAGRGGGPGGRCSSVLANRGGPDGARPRSRKRWPASIRPRRHGAWDRPVCGLSALGDARATVRSRATQRARPRRTHGLNRPGTQRATPADATMTVTEPRYRDPVAKAAVESVRGVGKADFQGGGGTEAPRVAPRGGGGPGPRSPSWKGWVGGADRRHQFHERLLRRLCAGGRSGFPLCDRQDQQGRRDQEPRRRTNRTRFCRRHQPACALRHRSAPPCDRRKGRSHHRHDAVAADARHLAGAGRIADALPLGLGRRLEIALALHARLSLRSRLRQDHGRFRSLAARQEGLRHQDLDAVLFELRGRPAGQQFPARAHESRGVPAARRGAARHQGAGPDGGDDPHPLDEAGSGAGARDAARRPAAASGPLQPELSRLDLRRRHRRLQRSFALARPVARHRQGGADPQSLRHDRLQSVGQDAVDAGDCRGIARPGQDPAHRPGGHAIGPGCARAATRHRGGGLARQEGAARRLCQGEYQVRRSRPLRRQAHRREIRGRPSAGRWLCLLRAMDGRPEPAGSVPRAIRQRPAHARAPDPISKSTQRAGEGSWRSSKSTA